MDNSSLVLLLALVFLWETIQTDYTNAFAPVTLAEEVYMELPHDFLPSDESDKLVLKLNKSLYGLCQAPLSWFTYLKQHLEAHGFRSSSIDQCLFYNKQLKVFCLAYILGGP